MEAEPPSFLAGRERVREAFACASEAHEGQERKGDGSPYINHPVELARLLVEAGEDDEDLLAAALLHDTVEDTEMTLEQIRERFGDRVHAILEAMTEHKDVEPYEARKDDHRDMVERAGEESAKIYAADKLANLRDMRSLYAAVGEGAAGRFNAPLDVRFRLWRRDLEMVETVVPGFELNASLRSELDAFEAERAATT
ncbi:hypothetical protein BH24ACT23_BH24ACT23_04520 [soil metagenome]